MRPGGSISRQKSPGFLSGHFFANALSHGRNVADFVRLPRGKGLSDIHIYICICIYIYIDSARRRKRGSAVDRSIVEERERKLVESSARSIYPTPATGHHTFFFKASACVYTCVCVYVCVCERCVPNVACNFTYYYSITRIEHALLIAYAYALALPLSLSHSLFLSLSLYISFPCIFACIGVYVSVWLVCRCVFLRDIVDVLLGS